MKTKNNSKTAKAARKERRTQAKERLATRRAKANVCVCGCGTPCHNLFAQGHDQRVRGMLIRHADKNEPLPKTLAQAIKAGLVKLVEHVRPNAKVLTAKAA